MKRRIFTVSSEIPLLGQVAFGLIDRGTNLIQVRPSSACVLNCIFCATDAGPYSKHRKTEYFVELDYLLEEFKRLVTFKGANNIEAHIDTVGDPFIYSKIIDLVQELREIPSVKVISTQTHGPLLNERLIDELNDAGLDRINLSIDSLDPEKAKIITGTKWYDLKKVLEIAKYIVNNTHIDLLVAPVWVPSINDDDIENIIKFAIKIGAGKKWPPLGIQKYERHKFGRKPKGIKEISWKKFYDTLRFWEQKYNIKLILKPKDFNIYKVKSPPKVYQIGEIARVKIMGPGWLKGEWLGVGRERSVTIVNVPKEAPPIGKFVKVRILRNKDNIYIGRLIK